MSYQENPYQVYGAHGAAQYAETDVRAAFIRRTYVHLAGAVAAFVGLECFWLSLPGIENVAVAMSGQWSWLLVLGGLVLVSYVADTWARSATSLTMQYAGLGLYVVAQSVIFIPIMLVALAMEAGSGTHNIVMPAAIMTVAAFAAMSAIVFITARDFSFLRTALLVVGLGAMGMIVLSIVFSFPLGFWFIGAMILLACGYILYDTSNVLHHYRTDQHVSAALALFASVAMLFWWILRLFMRLRD